MSPFRRRKPISSTIEKGCKSYIIMFKINPFILSCFGKDIGLDTKFPNDDWTLSFFETWWVGSNADSDFDVNCGIVLAVDVDASSW